MYLRKRKGYWLEVFRNGKDLSAMWHNDYSSIMHLANHNVQLGNVVRITNCENENEEYLFRG